MTSIKQFQIKRWLRQKKPRAIRVIVGFFALALLATYSSRFLSSVITPQVECETPGGGTIVHEVYTSGVVENVGESKQSDTKYMLSAVVDALEVAYVDESSVITAYSDEQKEYVDCELVSVEQDLTNDRNYNVTLQIPKDGFGIGQTVEVSVEQESKRYDYVLPWSAIRSTANGNYVLVAKPKQTILGEQLVATRVGVKLGDGNDTECGVSSAILSESDLVIIASDKNVEAGDSIRFMED